MLMHHIQMVVRMRKRGYNRAFSGSFRILPKWGEVGGGGGREITLDKLVKGGRGFGQAKIPSTNFSGKSSRVRHAVRSKPLTPTNFLQLILTHSWSVVARV